MRNQKRTNFIVTGFITLTIIACYGYYLYIIKNFDFAVVIAHIFSILILVIIASIFVGVYLFCY